MAVAVAEYHLKRDHTPSPTALSHDASAYRHQKWSHTGLQVCERTTDSLLGQEGRASNSQEITSLFLDTDYGTGPYVTRRRAEVASKNSWSLYYVYGGFYNVSTRRHELIPLPTAISERVP